MFFHENRGFYAIVKEHMFTNKVIITNEQLFLSLLYAPPPPLYNLLCAIRKKCAPMASSTNATHCIILCLSKSCILLSKPFRLEKLL